MAETVRSYRELKVWQKGIELVKMVYGLTQSFPKSETYGLSSQMQRAAEASKRRHYAGKVCGGSQTRGKRRYGNWHRKAS